MIDSQHERTRVFGVVAGDPGVFVVESDGHGRVDSVPNLGSVRSSARPKQKDSSMADTAASVLLTVIVLLGAVGGVLLIMALVAMTKSGYSK